MSELLQGLPAKLDLVPASRRPFKLSDQTVRAAMALPIPRAIPSSATPQASIIIITFNKLALTKLCVHTVLSEADDAARCIELILVDNASTDGTGEYLRDLQNARRDVRIILNKANVGFAAANNQGLAAARGEILVLLNNDTLISPGWLSTLSRHLRDPKIGLVGPVTNRTCNQAEIDAPYRTWAEFVRFAENIAREKAGCTFEIPMLAMFCFAMRRDVYQRLGALDEQFVVGMFEDDDYSRRARQAGLHVVCAEDTFVHHFGQASFGDLVPDGTYDEIFGSNRSRFERKWNITWCAPAKRPSAEYQDLVKRIQKIAADVLPRGAVVLVFSKGDDELLRLGEGIDAWHFPRDAEGRYAYEYPSDSARVIEHLNSLRAAGARFVVIPAPSFWWLEHYAQFAGYLNEQATLLWTDKSCIIHKLDLGTNV